MSGFLQDLRYGFRMLRKSPGFTAVAVVTLALGIGATTAIFSLVDSVLLRPLPFRDSQRLLMVFTSDRAHGFGDFGSSPPDYRLLRERNRTLESTSAFYGGAYNLSGGERPERLMGYAVSPDFFRTLGVTPILGRTFRDEEEQWGHHRVVIVSHEFWRSHLGANPHALGAMLILNREPYTVVGVMPPSFRILDDRQLWVPLSWAPGDNMNTRNNHFLMIIGRLKPGVTREQALADVNAVMDEIAREFPENQGLGANVKLLREQVVGDVRPALLVLLAAVGFVLLIACANLANLLLARANRRYKEVVLRAALGAGRRRVAQQLLTESLALALIGGGTGLALAYFALGLVPLAGDLLPRIHPIAIDGRALAFTLAVSIATSLFFGIAPALFSSRVNLSDALKQAGRGSEGDQGKRRVRSGLVVGEVAVALVLLIAAGLMIKSFGRLLSVNPGFDPHRVLSFVVDLPQSYMGAASASQFYTAPPRVAGFYDQLIARIQVLPGVKTVGAVSSLPLRGENWGKFINFDDRPVPPTLEQVPLIQYRAVDGDFFGAMGIRLLSGRTFGPGDRRGGPAVAVVNETLARRFWPNQNPIGKHISTNPPPSLVPANLVPPGWVEVWFTVIGVVEDAHYGGLAQPAMPTVYAPMSQGDWTLTMAITARTSADPNLLVTPVRHEMAQLDKDLPLAGVATMDQILSSSVAQPKLQSVLLGLFAGLALLLAIVGIYGVLSYSVPQRTHEIGIRMAVGAGRGEVVRMVIADGVRLTLLGVAIGLVLAVGITRALATLLFGVSPTDPLTFIAITLLVMLIAILASYIPARRAASVDPMVALRYE